MYVEGEAVEVSWSNQLCYLQPVSKEWLLALSAYLPSNLRIASWPAKAFNISLCLLIFLSAPVSGQWFWHMKAPLQVLLKPRLLAQSVQDGTWVFSTWMSSQVMLKLLVLRICPTPTLNIGPCPHICKTIIFLHNNKCIMFTPSFQKDNNTARYIF